MLTEHFVASIAASTRPSTGVTKDAGIFLHEFQPLAAQRHVFKKSASAANGLAVSDSHIFAAQSEKAVVHVYSREKGNQESIIPFPERIHSIVLAANDTVLLLGAESGRILAWEICSGRLVSTATSHLQPVTLIAVDPASNFFLSGSPDAMIHVWSLQSILSFSPDTSRSPIHTLSTHRAPLTSIVCGHSSSAANIAVSTSQDKSTIVWNYHTGQLLRTYLLPDAPTTVILDPADRAACVGYEDGSLQIISFYDEYQQTTPLDILHDGSSSHRPIQPSIKTRFGAESQKLGSVRSLSLSFDSTTLVSGHESGRVVTWDLAKGDYLSTLVSLPGPVTNLQFLIPAGFLESPKPKFKIHTVVKPKQNAASTSETALVPPTYSLNMQFTGRVSIPAISSTEKIKDVPTQFEEALTHPSFPRSMLEESLAELDNWNTQTNDTAAPAADFLSLSTIGYDGEATHDGVDTLAKGKDHEVKELKRQLAGLQRIQKVTFGQLADLREERDWFMKQERRRAARKSLKAKQMLGLVDGKTDDNGDVKMSSGSLDEGSSDAEATSNDSFETEEEADNEEGESSEA